MMSTTERPALPVILVTAMLATSCAPGIDTARPSAVEASSTMSQPRPGEAGCHEGIFQPADGVTIETRTDPAVIRQRAVRVDFARLESSPGRVVFNLFDDACLTAVRSPAAGTPSPADAWRGTVEGVANSNVTMVTASRTMIATIVAPPRTYQVRLMRDDVHLVNELDPSKYPKEK
jgi:hypothetical protein